LVAPHARPDTELKYLYQRVKTAIYMEIHFAVQKYLICEK